MLSVLFLKSFLRNVHRRFALTVAYGRDDLPRQGQASLEYG